MEPKDKSSDKFVVMLFSIFLYIALMFIVLHIVQMQAEDPSLTFFTAFLAVNDHISKRPFDISLEGMGSFGNLWWVGIKENDRLEVLARILRRRLVENDVPFDRKKFRPHVTLIRKQESVMPLSPNDFAGIIQGATMTVDHISLMRSDRGKNGMIYTEI